MEETNTYAAFDTIMDALQYIVDQAGALMESTEAGGPEASEVIGRGRNIVETAEEAKNIVMPLSELVADEGSRAKRIDRIAEAREKLKLISEPPFAKQRQEAKT